jgi:hypothetical protein
MLLLITALVIVLVGIAKAVSFAWGSPLFWLLATIATLIFLPITAGMSPLALFALIALRVVLVGRMLNSNHSR